MYPLTESISDLLEQPVREGPVNAMVHCPFHEDRTPSFSIHLEEGVWHCFSCGDSGTLSRLFRELGKEIDTNVRFYQAKRNAEAPIINDTNFAARANDCVRNAKGKDGQRYIRKIDRFLRERGISETTASTFGLGWSTEYNAIAFPYADLSGRVTGIKYRYPDGFKSSETGSHYGLYGVNHVVGKPKVIICEGESDTLVAHSRYGESFGVGGTSGASVSSSLWSRLGLHLLFASRIYLAYDADEAGDVCADTAMSVLGDKCRRLRPTKGKDISEHIMAGGDLEELGLG